jgi:hypothetical protein
VQNFPKRALKIQIQILNDELEDDDGEFPNFSEIPL